LPWPALPEPIKVGILANLAATGHLDQIGLMNRRTIAAIAARNSNPPKTIAITAPIVAATPLSFLPGRIAISFVLNASRPPPDRAIAN
jgi:hypothetical protein